MSAAVEAPARSDESFDYLFKVVLIGDSSVGKTCIVQRFKHGTYVEKHGNTIGVDFTIKTVDVDGKRVKLQIWDTAGQERFRTITQSYYRSAHGVLVVYDITNAESFDHVIHWLEDVKKYTGLDVHIVLVGTKLDLAVHHPHLRQVTQEEVLALAKSRHITHTLETSAKENTNVDACFNAMAQCLMNSETRVRPALSGSNASTEMGTTRPVQSSRCPC
eukprot:Em0001g214a